MRHVQSLAELMDADADPLDRAAHFAACDFIDHCVTFGMRTDELPSFPRMRKHFRRELASKRELVESADADLAPVTSTPISPLRYAVGWIAVILGVGLFVWWLGTLPVKP